LAVCGRDGGLVMRLLRASATVEVDAVAEQPAAEPGVELPGAECDGGGVTKADLALGVIGGLMGAYGLGRLLSLLGTAF
jgi:hypothetical protein